MQLDRGFLKVAAVCAGLSAVTTFLLWILPRLYAAPESFAGELALRANPYYMARLWVNFVHIFLALTAYAAAARVLRFRSPALAGLGFLWFVMWGFTELIGVATNIFAVNGTWRAQFTQSAPEVQDRFQTLILGFQGVWDALFFLLLAAFLLGSLFYGLAAWHGRGLERWIGGLFLLAVPLTIAIMIGGYTKSVVFEPLVTWVYPVLQPVSRGLLGWWLWSRARSVAEAG